MAPVTVKRKSMRFLAPMAKELQAISQDVIRSCNDSNMLITALQNLSTMTWNFEKGDLFQWVAVLDILDKELTRSDASSELTLEVLRCCRTLLENCSNRHVFNSFEHLQRLLESESCDIVMAVLRVLYVLAVPRSTRQVVADIKFTSKLTTLAGSWGALGAGERVMSIASCCLDEVDEWRSLGTTVHLETYKIDEDADSKGSKVVEGESTSEEGVTVVHIEQVDMLAGTEAEIFEEIICKSPIPKDSYFELKTKLRLARAFMNRSERQQWVRIQIVALTVLAQCQSSGGSVPVLLPVNEGCIVELIEILQHPRILLDMQTLALKALTALLSERSRQFSFLITANSTSHHGVLPSLIRKFKALIASPPSDMKEHIRFGEGLLGLTWTFAGSNTGASALHNAGIVHMLVPMLRDGNHGMVKFLTLAVKTLEVLMNYSQDMQHCFRELDGVSVLVDLAYEVVLRLGSDPMVISSDFSPSSCSAEFRFENCRLLSSILHLLSAAATPVATTTDVRELAAGIKLPSLLTAIFKQQNLFGAGVFEKAAALLTEFVHQEPGCLQQLISAGVAENFLASISGDFPPSRGVVNAIPSALGALCLSAAGTQLVEAAQPLDKLLKSLSSERVVFFLHGDCPSNLGVQLEELMRHNPSLLDSSMGGCVGLVLQIPLTMSTLDPSKSEMEISRHMYLITAVEFVGKLLEPLMSVAEHARSFIRRGGVKALLDILSLDDLPKNFSRTEAGKYLVLVIGKAASHSPSDVLGDLIQRTVGFLRAVEDRCPLQGLLETSLPSKLLEGNGEKQLLDLEMHSSLLAGVIASFRVSSAFSEWNTPAGSDLLQSASRCFVILRMAVSLLSKSNSPSSNQDVDPLIGNEMDIGLESGEAPPLLERGENSDAPAHKPDDILSQTHTALSALFARLTSAIAAPSRRRPDDRAAQPSNEKAVAGVLASSLNSLMEAIESAGKSPRVSRFSIEVVELLLVCVFGDDSLRSRSALNMVLLQELFDHNFITKFGKFTSRAVERISGFVQDPRSKQCAEADDVFQALSSCLSVVLRLLTTPFNALDRTGASVPHPGFDSNLFSSSLKVEVFNCVEPLLRIISVHHHGSISCPSTLTTLLFEFVIQHLKADTLQSTSASVTGIGAPPHVRQYDPQTVTALMEMGFDERRVHTALDAIRSNSVELATEWLFVHGLGSAGDDEESEIARAMALSLQQDGSGTSSETSASSERRSLPSIGEQRDTQAEILRSIMVDVCLEATSSEAPDSSSTLAFAVADVLNLLGLKELERSNIVSRLLDRLQMLNSNDKILNPEFRVGALLHVLSILFHDNSEFCQTALDNGALQKATEMLQNETRRLASSCDFSLSSWVCSCILVICALLKHLDDGKKIDTSDIKTNSSNAREDIEVKMSCQGDDKDLFASEGHDLCKAQHEFFVHACVVILRHKPSPLVNHAVLQLLTRLTRVHRNAAYLMQVGGIQVLLTSAAESSFTGQALLVGSILRHVLEDPQTLQTCMQTEIRALFSSLMARSNGRPLSLRAFLSSSAALAQRDPLVFSRALCACCHVNDNDGRRYIHLTDKKDEKVLPVTTGEQQHAAKLDAITNDSSVELPKSLAVGKGKSVSKLPEASTQLVGILVEQMFALIPSKTSAAVATLSVPTGADAGSQGMEIDQADQSTSVKDGVDKEKLSTALTLSNIMRFLSELVKFFPGCSHAVIKYNVPIKQRIDGSKRHSEGLLGFLLCELLPGHIELKGSEAALCSQRASQLVAALFGRGSDVRKKVVLEIVRAMQQPSSFTTRGSRTNYMHRLQALGDTLAMLLSSTKNTQVVGHAAPDTAKIFLDAALPSTISSALAAIDLQHPLASKVANSLLRPLDLMCAVPMSMTRQRTELAEAGGNAEHPTSSNVSGFISTSGGQSAMVGDVPASRVSTSVAGGQAEAVRIDGPPEGDESGGIVSDGGNESMSDSIRGDNSAGLEDGREVDAGSSMADAASAPVASGGPDRNSQGELNRLMAVLRHMERDAAVLGGEGSEGSEERGPGDDDDDDDEDEDDDDEEHEEGSEDEESTLDVDEESDDDEDDDDEEDGAGGEHDNGADFLGDDLFSNDLHAHEDVGIAWPRSHEIVINSEQELDSLVQRVMQHPQVRMTRGWGGDVEGENADLDIDADGQMLGFWMPGGGRAVSGHGPPSGLHEMFQDMQVIQFPSRAARTFGVGGTGAVRVAVNESVAGAHPFLSRGSQNASRYTRAGSSRSRAAGMEEYRALVQSAQAPGFLRSQLGGRLVLGDPSGQNIVREEIGVEGGWSRWTDDGGGSNAAMRSAALGLEASIQSALSPARQATSVGEAGVMEQSTVGLTASTETHVSASVAPAMDTVGNSTLPLMVEPESYAEPSSSSGPVSDPALHHDPQSSSSPSNAMSMGPTAMDAASLMEDSDGGLEDNAELALALRLSMESGGPHVGTSVNDAELAPNPPVENASSGPVLSSSADHELNSGAVNSVPHPQGDSSESNREGESAIDAAFLAELPEELRAEVIAQQSSQGGARWSGGAAIQSSNPDVNTLDDGGIDPEFLAALPPDIQADVLRQHQRAQASAAAMDAPNAGAGEMDNGSFIATLSAELREEVLLTADEAFIASLPPHLAAEAALLRERAYHAASSRAAPLLAPGYSSMGARRPAPAISSSSRVPGDDTRGTADTELRQVLPCGSEKSVTRLVELSSGVNKGLLHSVLLHLCAHACTRPPTVRLLLAQALSPALARSELSRTSGSYPGSVAGLARRALEALCHLTALQPEVVSLLMDRTLLADNENLSTVAAPYSGKGKNRAESRSDRGSNRAVESGAGCASCEKHETNALDKMLLRLAEPDVIKNAATLDLFAQLILATVVAAKPSAGLQVDASAIPVLGEAAFRSLAVALGALGAGRQTGERLMGALQALCTHEKNRRVCVPLLLEHLRLAAVDCCKNLSSLDTSDPQGYYNGAVDEESSYADLRLLRLAKTLRSVWTASPISSGQSAMQSDASKPSSSSSDLKGEGKFATDSTLSCVVGEDSLWSLLSSCLASIESHHTAASKSMSSASSIPPALSRLQPLVEAYFVVHAPLSPPSLSSGNSLVDQAGTAHRGRPGLASEGASPPSEPWIEFAEKHRNSLNAYLRQDKTLLQSSSTFAGLVAFPKLLDFDNKKCYFRAELKRRNANQRHSTLRISVRREYVLEDSFHQMVLRRPDELKGRLHVTFQGEEGVDAGGLSREWFLTLSKQMLNPDKALFLPSVNGLTFQPNPASGIQPDHIGYFRFAGQVVAKALWDEQLLDAHFTLSLYKHILNQPIEVKDVESIDPEYFKNLGWMLENDITSVLEETFSIVREQFGEMLTIDLKPNGRNLSVTESNKHEYVQLVAEHVMTKGIRDQVDALKQGFHELIPSDLIQIFSPQELELLLCGLPSIDVDDLRANTEYTGYTRDSPQIQWFWSIVQGLCQEDLARLLQFVTGTSQVPMEGFQALRGMNGPQRFNIHRCGDSGRLPSSHTCFNQLDLPEYPSSDVLQRCLLSAIREGFEGFGFS